MTTYDAIVRDNRDPDELGRLRLEVPGLFGSDRLAPGWVPARIGPAGGGGVGLWWIPPVNARVVVEIAGAGQQLRWIGTELGRSARAPSWLRAAGRAGLTSPSGTRGLLLDDQRVTLTGGAPSSAEALLLGDRTEEDHAAFLGNLQVFVTALKASTDPAVAAAAAVFEPLVISYRAQVSGGSHRSLVSSTE